MAFKPGYKSRILAGSINLSTKIDSMGMASTADTLETTTFAAADNTDNVNKTFIAGMTSSTFDASGPLDTDTTDATTAYNILDAWSGELPLSYCPSGSAALAECFLMSGFRTSFNTTSQNSGRVDMSLTSQNTGPTDAGYVLEDLAAVTATVNGTSRDLTAATTTGAVAHLHVTAFSGLTSETVTVEDSSTGSSGWATIGTFAAATGLTGETIVIAGTVKRYVRVVDTVVGTGSVTRAVTFARR